MKKLIKTFLPYTTFLRCKKYLLLFPVLLVSAVCSAKPDAGVHIPEDSNRSKILIISSYDVQSMEARKNKKELFAELVATLQKELASEIGFKTMYEPVINQETMLPGNNFDSLLSVYIQVHNPTKTIVIKAFDIWFEQTGVDVTEEEDGKKRTASFDICSNVNYYLYNGEIFKEEKETKYREHFTERNVASGFLAMGPDIVGKRKYAIQLMTKNAIAFMQSAGSWLSTP